MGQELDCRVHYRSRTLAGKAYLEGGHIVFRGEERLKIAIKDLASVRAHAGVLHLDFPGGPVSLELGAAAEKWAPVCSVASFPGLTRAPRAPPRGHRIC